MALLGSVGLGLVWGWWLALVTAGSLAGKRPFPLLSVLVLPTLLFPWLLSWLVGWETAVLFLGAAFFSLLAHLAWRQRLAFLFW